MQDRRVMSVAIVTKLLAQQLRKRYSVPDNNTIYVSSPKVQTVTGATQSPAYYRGLCLEIKAVGAYSWQ
jgi:hypothetical protein